MAGNSFIAAGGEQFSHGNSLDQDILELTRNATIRWLGNHALTLGTHNENFSFLNVFFGDPSGVWSFNNVDRLEADTADRYEINLPGARGRTAGWPTGASYQFGLYAPGPVVA